jgi:hypothetical protein
VKRTIDKLDERPEQLLRQISLAHPEKVAIPYEPALAVLVERKLVASAPGHPHAKWVCTKIGRHHARLGVVLDLCDGYKRSLAKIRHRISITGETELEDEATSLEQLIEAADTIITGLNNVLASGQ